MSLAPKVKGTVLKDAVSALRRLRERLTIPAHLLPYLEQEVEIINWYPEEDLADIMRLLLSAQRKPREVALRRMGRSLAEVHLSGVYARNVRRDLQTATPQLWRAQHDTGDFSCAFSDAGVRFRLVDWRSPDADVCGTFTGYLEVVLEYADIDVGRVEKVACTHRANDACEWFAPLRRDDDEQTYRFKPG